MSPGRTATTLVLVLLLIGSSASAKEITKGATPSQNKIHIRTDGLACYFCAYGLERFFKKTERIASFDMNMKEGIVEVGLIQGKPLVSARDFNQYVHDAGFTPRWIRAELVGRFAREGDALVFLVAETAEKLPLEDGVSVRELPAEAFKITVRLTARVLEHDKAPFALEFESYERVLIDKTS